MLHGSIERIYEYAMNYIKDTEVCLVCVVRHIERNPFSSPQLVCLLTQQQYPKLQADIIANSCYHLQLLDWQLCSSANSVSIYGSRNLNRALIS
jgi:hypothetical protein